MEETNEKLLKFTLRFKDDLAVLQASESNELHCENFEVNLKIKNVFMHKFILLCYKRLSKLWMHLGVAKYSRCYNLLA